MSPETHLPFLVPGSGFELLAMWGGRCPAATDGARPGASSTWLERALLAPFSQQHLQGTQLLGVAGGGGPRYLRGSPERFTALANITSSPGELTGSSEIINN